MRPPKTARPSFESPENDPVFPETGTTAGTWIEEAESARSVGAADAAGPASRATGGITLNAEATATESGPTGETATPSCASGRAPTIFGVPAGEIEGRTPARPETGPAAAPMFPSPPRKVNSAAPETAAPWTPTGAFTV